MSKGRYMKRYELVALLLELAMQGCARAPVKLDKTKVAGDLGASAWMLRKWLREAASAGYVQVVFGGKVECYLLTERAVAELKSLLDRAAQAVSGASRVVLTGRVLRGLGEGSFYLSLAEYREWFRHTLGFEPYPGTLNVRLDPESVAKRELLNSYGGYRIPPVRRGEQEYCSAKVFRAVINSSVEGGVVIPDVTVYSSEILEVVAKPYLREALTIKDGDLVTVEVLLEQSACGPCVERSLPLNSTESAP